MQEETRVCMLRLLAARNLMLRILAATAESDSSTLLLQLSAELKQLDDEYIPQILQKFDIDGKLDQPCKILIPMDAVERLREAHNSEQLRTIACLAKSLSNSHCPDFDCIQMLRMSTCLQLLPLPEQNMPVSFKNFLLRASTCSESLAIISAMCSAIALQAKPRSSQKKNKKKCNKKIETVLSNNIDQVSLRLFIKDCFIISVQNLLIIFIIHYNYLLYYRCGKKLLYYFRRDYKI